MVGAIHGRLLTAWAAAGVLGPVLVNYLREYQLSIGVERAAAYDITLYILAGLLVLGFLCNLLVRPVADKYFMTDAELAAEQALGHDKGADASTVLEWKADAGYDAIGGCGLAGGGYSVGVGCVGDPAEDGGTVPLTPQNHCGGACSR